MNDLLKKYFNFRGLTRKATSRLTMVVMVVIYTMSIDLSCQKPSVLVDRQTCRGYVALWFVVVQNRNN